jgi:hypothetical protein
MSALPPKADYGRTLRHVRKVPKLEVNRRVYSSPACHFLALGLVLPLHIIDLQVTGNGCANGWEKILLAKLREQSESLQLVLYWILQFGKAEPSPGPSSRNLMTQPQSRCSRRRFRPGSEGADIVVPDPQPAHSPLRPTCIDGTSKWGLDLCRCAPDVIQRSSKRQLVARL